MDGRTEEKTKADGDYFKEKEKRLRPVIL